MAKDFENVLDGSDAFTDHNHPGLPLTNFSNLDISFIDRVKPILIDYPDLFEFYYNAIEIPGGIFIPDKLLLTLKNIQTDSSFGIQLVTFINTLSMLDIIHFGGDGNGIMNLFKRSLMDTKDILLRSDSIESLSGGRSTTLSMIKTTLSEVFEDLDKYSPLIAFYGYCILCHITGIDNEYEKRAPGRG